MNKKGAPILKMIIFLIGSLIVGALIIFAFPNLVHKLMANAEEQIVAKDIGLTIMTLAASPNDVVYRYDKNTEKYEIRISGNKIKVTSLEGSGEYEFIPMENVKVENAVLDNVMIIPMTLKNGVISFKDEDISYTDFCADIPQTFTHDYLYVKVDVAFNENTLSAKKLELIKSALQMYATQANSKVVFVEEDEDLVVTLKTSQNEAPEISYYTNTDEESQTISQEYSWYNRIACYATNELGNEKTFKIPKLTPSSEEKITIDFGNTDEFIKLTDEDVQMTSRISKEIYNAFIFGVTE